MLVSLVGFLIQSFFKRCSGSINNKKYFIIENILEFNWSVILNTFVAHLYVESVGRLCTTTMVPTIWILNSTD